MTDSERPRVARIPREQELQSINRICDVLFRSAPSAGILQRVEMEIAAATGFPFVNFDFSGQPGKPDFQPAFELTIPLKAEQNHAGALRIASPEAVQLDPATQSWMERIAALVAYWNSRQGQKQSEPGLDPQTSLPNTSLFQFLFQQAVGRARRSKQILAILHFHLDGLRAIRESSGAEQAASAVRQVGERLSQICREGDFLAHDGDGHMLWAVSSLRKLESLALIAEKAIERIAVPIQVQEREVSLTCCVGIAIFPSDGADSALLLKHAEAALSRARELGNNKYQFYSEILHGRVSEQVAFGRRLKQAADRNEFLLHFQPLVNVATRAVEGVEALVRWRGPDGRLALPGEFLAAGESAGLMDQLDQWVIAHACEQVQGWEAAGRRSLILSVNISDRLFKRKDFHWKVSAILRETGIRPEMLELDIPHAVLLEDLDFSAQVLKKIRVLGVRIAVDDFGRGFLDLNHLKLFSIDTLKINPTFIKDLATGLADSDVIAAIISFAHNMKMRVVAIGVEKEAQLEVIRKRHCDLFQGNLFSAPVAAAQFEELVYGDARTQSAHKEDEALTDLLEAVIEKKAPEEIAAASAPAPIAHSRSIRFYLANCFHCSQIFDALLSKWCACLVVDHTLVCQNCGECFCDAPASYQIDFWTEAPQLMWERRTREEEQRAKDAAPNPPRDAARPFVLIADSEPAILAAAQRAGTNLGYTVITARNGEEAFQLAKGYKPEFLIADAFLQNVDAPELCRRIKSDAALASTQLVLLTSPALQDNNRLKALRGCGADAFHQKPLSLKALRSLLQNKLQ